MNLNDFNWHDAILKRIEIDRADPGINDTVRLVILWQDSQVSEFTFRDVYSASLNLNLGVIADESIYSLEDLSASDADVAAFLEKWRRFVPEIEKLNFIEIKTSSTGSTIRIFFKDVVVNRTE